MRLIKRLSALAVLVGSMVFGAGPAHAEANYIPCDGADLAPFPTFCAPGRVTAQDAFFLRSIYESSLAEIAFSELALDISRNAAVRALAAEIIDDHEALLDEIEMVARDAGVVLSTQLSVQHRIQLQQLSLLRGRIFDIQYTLLMIQEHQIAIALAQAEVRFGCDPEVRQLARDVIPVLQQHLRDARTVLSRLLF